MSAIAQSPVKHIRLPRFRVPLLEFLFKLLSSPHSGRMKAPGLFNTGLGCQGTSRYPLSISQPSNGPVIWVMRASTRRWHRVLARMRGEAEPAGPATVLSGMMSKTQDPGKGKSIGFNFQKAEKEHLFFLFFFFLFFHRRYYFPSQLVGGYMYPQRPCGQAVAAGGAFLSAARYVPPRVGFSELPLFQAIMLVD